MADSHALRVSRELFLAAFGADFGAPRPWVTDRLASALEDEVTHAGHAVFCAGDAPDFYYFMREGRVRMVHPARTPWTYEGPCAFGMSDALLQRPRARTALAETDIEAMKVQSEVWMELLEDSFDLARTAVEGAVIAVARLEERTWLRAPPPGGAGPVTDGGDPLARLAALAEAPLLRSAGVQTLSDLAEETEEIAFTAGDVLFERGAGARAIYLVTEGLVEAGRESPDVTWRGGPGTIVGGFAAFGAPIAAWQARARTPGRALAFLRSDWLDLLEASFETVRATLGALSLERERLLEQLG